MLAENPTWTVGKWADGLEEMAWLAARLIESRALLVKVHRRRGKVESFSRTQPGQPSVSRLNN